MFSDSTLPGNATPRVVLVGGTPVAAAVGPEVEQVVRGRANAQSTGMMGAVGAARMHGRPGRTAKVDLRSPQWFVSHPRLVDTMAEASVGIDTGGPQLPGRVRPTEHDGEPGWRSSVGGH